MANDNPDTMHAYFTAGFLAGRPGINGVTALCALLASKGILSHAEVEGVFRTMEAAISNGGDTTAFVADADREFIQRQRDVILNAPYLQG